MFLAIARLAVAAPLFLLTAFSASVSGIVVDSSGAPIGDAKLRLSAAGPPGRPFSADITADGRGTFEMKNVPSGDYTLCAVGRAANHVNSCIWQRPMTSIHVVKDEQITNIELIIETGILLHVHFRDPEHRIASGSKLDLTISADSGQFSRLSCAGDKALDFDVALPKNLTGRLMIETSLSVTDDAGHSVPTGIPALPISTGDQADVTVNLTVK